MILLLPDSHVFYPDYAPDFTPNFSPDFDLDFSLDLVWISLQISVQTLDQIWFQISVRILACILAKISDRTHSLISVSRLEVPYPRVHRLEPHWSDVHQPGFYSLRVLNLGVHNQESKTQGSTTRGPHSRRSRIWGVHRSKKVLYEELCCNNGFSCMDSISI